MKFCGLQVVSSEQQSSITLADALAQLHLDAGFDDGKVADALEAAYQYAEGYLWQSLRAQTILAAYEPDGANFAELMRANFGELVSASYFDGETHAIDVATIKVDASLPVARAYFAEPKIEGDYFAPIKIVYKTSAPSVFPQQIKQAILIATAQFYDDRDAPDLTAVDNILNIYKTRNFL